MQDNDDNIPVGKREEEVFDAAPAWHGGTAGTEETGEDEFEVTPFSVEEDPEQVALIQRGEIQVQSLKPGERAKYTFSLNEKPTPVNKTFNGEIFAPGFGYSRKKEDKHAVQSSVKKAVSLLWEHESFKAPTECNVVELRDQYYEACADYQNQSEAKQKALSAAYATSLESINNDFIHNHQFDKPVSFVNDKMAQVVAYLQNVSEDCYHIEYEYNHASVNRDTRPQVFYSKDEHSEDQDSELKFKSLSFSVKLHFNSGVIIPAVVTVDADNNVTLESSESGFKLKEEGTDHIAVEKLSVKDLDGMRMEALREYSMFIMNNEHNWKADLGPSRLFDDFGNQSLSQGLIDECPTYVYLQTHQLGLYPSWMSEQVGQIDVLLAEHGFVEGTRKVMGCFVTQIRDNLKALLSKESFSKALYAKCRELYSNHTEQYLIRSLMIGFTSKLYRTVFHHEYSGKTVDAFKDSLCESVLSGYLTQELMTKVCEISLEALSTPLDSARTNFSETAFSQLDSTVTHFDETASEQEQTSVKEYLLAAWERVLTCRAGAGFTPQSYRALIEFCSEHKLLEHPETAEQLSGARESKSAREAIYQTIVTNDPVSMVSLVAYFDFTTGSDIRKELVSNFDDINVDSMGRIPKFENLSPELQQDDNVVRQYEALALLETLKEKAKLADSNLESRPTLIEFCFEHKLLERPEIAKQLSGVRESKSEREAIYQTIVTNDPVSMVSLVAYFDFTMGSDIREELVSNFDDINVDSMGRISRFEDLSPELQRNDNVVRQYEALALLETLKEKAKLADNDPEDARYGADFHKDVQIVLREIKALRHPKLSLGTLGRQVIHSNPLRERILERATAIFEIHDSRASRRKKLWRSIKAKLPWNSVGSLKQKRKVKFLAKYKVFHPKDERDLRRQMSAEIERIRDVAAEEISTAKSFSAIQKVQKKTTDQLSPMGAHSGLDVSLRSPLGKERDNAITAIFYMKELCSMPFLQAEQYYNYSGEPTPYEADAEQPWTLEQRLFTGVGEGEAHRFGIKEVSLINAADYYKKIPEDLRPKFAPVKEAVEKQIEVHAQQRLEELERGPEIQKALWNDIQDAIEMDIDVPLLVDALSKLAPVLYYPNENFETKFDELLDIPEEQKLALTGYDIDKLVTVRNALNYVIENRPVDHAQFSEMQRLKAQAMVGFLDAIIERYDLNAEAYQSNGDHYPIDTKVDGEYLIHTEVLEFFGAQSLRLSSARAQALITKQLGNNTAVSYRDGMNRRAAGASNYSIGMAPHEKILVTAPNQKEPDTPVYAGMLKKMNISEFKQAVDASLKAPNEDPNREPAVTFVRDAVKRMSESLRIDESVAHQLARSSSLAQGYPSFDTGLHVVGEGAVEKNRGTVKALEKALASAYADSEIHLDYTNSSVSAGNSELIKSIRCFDGSDTVVEMRALPNGILQHQVLQNVKTLGINDNSTVRRTDNKPFMILKKVFHIVPVPGGNPKVQLVDYRLYPLHPVAEVLAPLLDRTSSDTQTITAGTKYFEPAQENQFGRSGVINPINFEKALLGKLKAAAERYLRIKYPAPRNNDKDDTRSMPEVIEASKHKIGHNATYQARLVLDVIKALEDNQDIVTEADYKAAIRTVASIHDQVSKRSRLRIMLRVVLDEPAGKRAIKASPLFSCAIGKVVGDAEMVLHHIHRQNKRFKFLTKPLKDANSVVFAQINSSDTWLDSMIDAGWSYLNSVAPEIGLRDVESRLKKIADLAPRTNSSNREYVHEHYKFMHLIYQKVSKIKALLRAAKNGPNTSFDDLKSEIEEIKKEIEEEAEKVIQKGQGENQQNRMLGAGVGPFLEALGDEEDSEDELDEEITLLEEDIVNRIQTETKKLINFEFQGFLNREKLKYNARVARLRGIEEPNLVSINKASKEVIDKEPPEKADFTSLTEAVSKARNAIAEKSEDIIEKINKILDKRCNPTHARETHDAHIFKVKLATTRSFNTLVKDTTSTLSRIMAKSVELNEKVIENQLVEVVQDEIEKARSTVILSLETAKNILKEIPEDGAFNTRETPSCKEIKNESFKKLETESVEHFKKLLEREIQAVAGFELAKIDGLNEDSVEDFLNDALSRLNELLLKENSCLSIEVAGEVLKNTNVVENLAKAANNKIASLREKAAFEDELDEFDTELNNSSIMAELKRARLTLFTKFWLKELKEIKDVDKLAGAMELAQYYLDASVPNKNEEDGAAERTKRSLLVKYVARKYITYHKSKIKECISKGRTIDAFLELDKCAKIISDLMGQFKPIDKVLKEVKTRFDALVKEIYGETTDTSNDKLKSVLVDLTKESIRLIKESTSSRGLNTLKNKTESLLTTVKKGQTENLGIALASSVSTLREEVKTAVTDKTTRFKVQSIVETNLQLMEKQNSLINLLLLCSMVAKEINKIEINGGEAVASAEKQKAIAQLDQKVAERLHAEVEKKAGIDPKIEVTKFTEKLEAPTNLILEEINKALDSIENDESAVDNLSDRIGALTLAVIALINENASSIKFANAMEKEVDRILYGVETEVRRRFRIVKKRLKKDNLTSEKVKQYEKQEKNLWNLNEHVIRLANSSRNKILQAIITKNKAVYTTWLPGISKILTNKVKSDAPDIQIRWSAVKEIFKVKSLLPDAIPSLQAYMKDVFDKHPKGSGSTLTLMNALVLRQQRVNREIKTLSKMNVTGNSKLQRLQKAAVTQLINEQVKCYEEVYKENVTSFAKVYFAEVKEAMISLEDTSKLSNYDAYRRFNYLILKRFEEARDNLASLNIPKQYAALRAKRSKLERTMTEKVMNLSVQATDIQLTKEPKKLSSMLLNTSEAIIGVMFTGDERRTRTSYFFKDIVRDAVSKLLTKERAEAILDASDKLDPNHKWAREIFVKDVTNKWSHIGILQDIQIILAYSSLSEDMQGDLSNRLYEEIEKDALKYGLKTHAPEWKFLEEIERNKAIETYANYFVGIPEEERVQLVKAGLSELEDPYLHNYDKCEEAASNVLNYQANLRAWAIELNKARQDYSEEDYYSAEEDLRPNEKEEEEPYSDNIPEVVTRKIKTILKEHNLPENHPLYEEALEKVRAQAAQLLEDALAITRGEDAASEGSGSSETVWEEAGLGERGSDTGSLSNNRHGTFYHYSEAAAERPPKQVHFPPESINTPS